MEFREGDVAITQGADGDNFYVVVSGKCNCYVGSRDETGLVAECGPGDSYGELALMYNAPRAASVVAATDSTLWALDRSSFTALLMKSAIDKRKAHMDFLEYTPLLSILSSYDRMTLADSLSSRNYEAGAKIIEQGAAADGMFVVWEGDVVVSRRLGDVGGEPAEEEEVLSKLKRGDYFGCAISLPACCTELGPAPPNTKRFGHFDSSGKITRRVLIACVLALGSWRWFEISHEPRLCWLLVMRFACSSHGKHLTKVRNLPSRQVVLRLLPTLSYSAGLRSLRSLGTCARGRHQGIWTARIKSVICL